MTKNQTVTPNDRANAVVDYIMTNNFAPREALDLHDIKVDGTGVNVPAPTDENVGAGFWFHALTLAELARADLDVKSRCDIHVTLDGTSWAILPY